MPFFIEHIMAHIRKYQEGNKLKKYTEQDITSHLKGLEPGNFSDVLQYALVNTTLNDQFKSNITAGKLTDGTYKLINDYISAKGYKGINLSEIGRELLKFEEDYGAYPEEPKPVVPTKKEAFSFMTELSKSLSGLVSDKTFDISQENHYKAYWANPNAGASYIAGVLKDLSKDKNYFNNLYEQYDFSNTSIKSADDLKTRYSNLITELENGYDPKTANSDISAIAKLTTDGTFLRLLDNSIKSDGTTITTTNPESTTIQRDALSQLIIPTVKIGDTEVPISKAWPEHQTSLLASNYATYTPFTTPNLALLGMENLPNKFRIGDVSERFIPKGEKKDVSILSILDETTGKERYIIGKGDDLSQYKPFNPIKSTIDQNKLVFDDIEYSYDPTKQVKHLEGLLKYNLEKVPNWIDDSEFEKNYTDLLTSKANLLNQGYTQFLQALANSVHTKTKSPNTRDTYNGWATLKNDNVLFHQYDNDGNIIPWIIAPFDGGEVDSQSWRIFRFNNSPNPRRTLAPLPNQQSTNVTQKQTKYSTMAPAPRSHQVGGKFEKLEAIKKPTVKDEQLSNAQKAMYSIGDKRKTMSITGKDVFNSKEGGIEKMGGDISDYDRARWGATLLDILSMGIALAPAPGMGIAGGAIGAVGSVGHFIADQSDGFQLGDLVRFASNLGADGISMTRFGALAKLGRIRKGVAFMLPGLSALMLGTQITDPTQRESFGKTFEKLGKFEFTKLNTTDLSNIRTMMAVVTTGKAVVGGSKNIQKNLQSKTTKDSSVLKADVEFKGKDGNPVKRTVEITNPSRSWKDIKGGHRSGEVSTAAKSKVKSELKLDDADISDFKVINYNKKVTTNPRTNWFFRGLQVNKPEKLNLWGAEEITPEIYNEFLNSKEKFNRNPFNWDDVALKFKPVIIDNFKSGGKIQYLQLGDSFNIPWKLKLGLNNKLYKDLILNKTWGYEDEQNKSFNTFVANWQKTQSPLFSSSIVIPRRVTESSTSLGPTIGVGNQSVLPRPKFDWYTMITNMGNAGSSIAASISNYNKLKNYQPILDSISSPIVMPKAPVLQDVTPFKNEIFSQVHNMRFSDPSLLTATKYEGIKQATDLDIKANTANIETLNNYNASLTNAQTLSNQHRQSIAASNNAKLNELSREKMQGLADLKTHIVKINSDVNKVGLVLKEQYDTKSDNYDYMKNLMGINTELTNKSTRLAELTNMSARNSVLEAEKIRLEKEIDELTTVFNRLRYGSPWLYEYHNSGSYGLGNPNKTSVRQKGGKLNYIQKLKSNG